MTTSFSDLMPSMADKWLSVFPEHVAKSLRGFGWVTARNVMASALKIMCEQDTSILGLLTRDDVVSRRSVASWDLAQVDDGEAINCFAPHVVVMNIKGTSDYGDLWAKACERAVNDHVTKFDYRTVAQLANRAGCIQRTIFNSLCRAWFAGAHRASMNVATMLCEIPNKQILCTESQDWYILAAETYKSYADNTLSWTSRLVSLPAFDVDPRDPSFSYDNYMSALKEFTSEHPMPQIKLESMATMATEVSGTRRILNFIEGRNRTGDVFTDTREIASKLEQAHMWLGQSPLSIYGAVVSSLSRTPYGMCASPDLRLTYKTRLQPVPRCSRSRSQRRSGHPSVLQPRSGM